jgi:calcineurin-like phosphoesterase family protein
MGHRNIIGLCSRPFADIEEMEGEIIERHNAVVGPDDVIYDLGDFAYRCSPEHAAECVRRLNGRRTILWGNHDKPLRQAVRRGLLGDLVESGKVTFVGDPDPRFQTGLNVVIGSQRIILAHYAQRTWQGAFRGAWHLYGHSHGNLQPFGKSMDIGGDAWDFRPVSFEDIRARMDAVTEEFHED